MWKLLWDTVHKELLSVKLPKEVDLLRVGVFLMSTEKLSQTYCMVYCDLLVAYRNSVEVVQKPYWYMCQLLGSFLLSQVIGNHLCRYAAACCFCTAAVVKVLYTRINQHIQTINILVAREFLQFVSSLVYFSCIAWAKTFTKIYHQYIPILFEV